MSSETDQIAKNLGAALLSALAERALKKGLDYLDSPHVAEADKAEVPPPPRIEGLEEGGEEDEPR